MVDGLKPGQRKIMFACFKRNLKADVKVSQLSGYVSEHSGGWEASRHLMMVVKVVLGGLTSVIDVEG
jgi:DNA topoisomerase-2